MQIAIGSHRKGIIPTAEANQVAHDLPVETCSAERGDLLVLHMLTLHMSEPVEIQADRRALRIDFAPSELPNPLNWLYLDGREQRFRLNPPNPI